MTREQKEELRKEVRRAKTFEECEAVFKKICKIAWNREEKMPWNKEVFEDNDFAQCLLKETLYVIIFKEIK